MERAFIALLLADDGVEAAVGRRVWPMVRPQGSSLPALVVHRIGGLRGYNMGGPDNLVQTRMQVDAWGERYASAKLAARAAIAALSGQAVTQGGVRFQGIFVDNEVDEFDASKAQSGQADRLFRTRVDFIAWHTGE